jgi:hypothetical protein
MQDVGKASGAAEDAVWVYLCDIPAANVAEYGRVCITGATPAGHNLEAKVVSESAEIVVPVGYCGELDARQVTVVPAAAVGRTQQIHGYHEIVG